jgi:glycosyltransferase involved in cell wall biosynthesis
MEIIHVVLGKANPERMNGVNKVVYQLATKQKLAGKNVSVWGITADLTVNYPARNFETVLFKAYTNKFKLDANFITALKAKAGKAIFHLHGGFNPIFYTISKQLAKHNIPYVFTPHGAYNTIAMERSKYTKKLYLQLFEKPLLKRAAVIHSIGVSEVDGLQTIYTNTKSKLVAYGYENTTEETATPDAEKFIVGFCGRLDIYTKGLDLLVKAFAKFTVAVPQAKLWIIGDSSERDDFFELVKEEGIADNVVFYGSVFGQEKTDLLKQVHVFAHPSRNEGLPASVLEAAALGLPCVVTRATNTGDVIKKHNAGAVVEQPDANELYNALLQVKNVIDAEGIGSYSQRCKAMVNQEFNWNKVVVDFDKMYAAA